jgi:hypothetical protein
MIHIKRYQKLSLLAGVLAILFTLLFVWYAQTEFEKERLDIKINSVRLEVDEMAADVNETFAMYPDYDWSFIQRNVHRWDLQPDRYAAVYQGGKLLSDRNTEYENTFNPYDYEAFTRTFQLDHNRVPNHGECTLPYDSGDEVFDLFVYWVRIPRDSDNPYIVINGVSERTIQTAMSPLWAWALWIFVSLSVILMLLRTLLEFFMVTKTLEQNQPVTKEELYG